MLLPNLVFDALVFGALILAAALDYAFPATGGALGMLAVGGALYVASQELCESLSARKLWSSESLATSVAPVIALLVFFWGRNGSDFALLLLSIGLMMAALMTTIGAIAALGATWREKSASPLLGLLLTVAGSIALGLAGGVLTLSSPLLLSVSVLGFVVWKVREAIARPTTPSLASPAKSESAPSSVARPRVAAPEPSPTPPAPGRPLLVPQRGTLFHRLLPVLVLGLLAFFVLRGARVTSVFDLGTPAVARQDDAR